MHRSIIQETINALREIDLESIDFFISQIKNCIENFGCIFVCGNGGSHTDASHFVGELVGSYHSSTDKPLRSILLSTGEAAGSSISNDLGYDRVFSRQLSALSNNESDVLIALSTSGNSRNILEALNTAESMRISSLLMTGQNYDSTAKYKKTTVFKAPTSSTPVIQHCHILTLHYICDSIQCYR